MVQPVRFKTICIVEEGSVSHQRVCLKIRSGNPKAGGGAGGGTKREARMRHCREKGCRRTPLPRRGRMETAQAGRPPSSHDQEDEEGDEEDDGRRGEEQHAGRPLVGGLGLLLVLRDAHLLHHALHDLDVGLGEVLPFGGGGHRVLLHRDVDAVVHEAVLVAVLVHGPVVHLVGVPVHVLPVVAVLVVVAEVDEGPAHGAPQHVAAEAPHHRPSRRCPGHVLHAGFRLTGLAPLVVGTSLTPATTVGLPPATAVGLSPATTVRLPPAAAMGLSPAAALGWVAVASRAALTRVPAPPCVPSSSRLRPLLAEAHVTPRGHKEKQHPVAEVRHDS
uniref:Uncharacterized protein n=1 Tax=Oryctolagus cuniculus TaxID=9986 RepID=A0A5F9D6T3_RABIT